MEIVLRQLKDNNLKVLEIPMKYIGYRKHQNNNTNNPEYSLINFFEYKKISDLIEHKIKQEFSSALKVLKDNNADAVGAYDILYAQNKKEFKKYLKSLENKNDYLKNVSFRVIVNSNEYI